MRVGNQTVVFLGAADEDSLVVDGDDVENKAGLFETTAVSEPKREAKASHLCKSNKEQIASNIAGWVTLMLQGEDNPTLNIKYTHMSAQQHPNDDEEDMNKKIHWPSPEK